MRLQRAGKFNASGSHRHDAQQASGVFDCELECQPTAERVADDPGFLDPESVEYAHGMPHPFFETVCGPVRIRSARRRSSPWAIPRLYRLSSGRFSLRFTAAR